MMCMLSLELLISNVKCIFVIRFQDKANEIKSTQDPPTSFQTCSLIFFPNKPFSFLGFKERTMLYTMKNYMQHTHLNEATIL